MRPDGRAPNELRPITFERDYTERLLNPYVAAERGFVDAVIEPADTRPVLIKTLRMLRTKREQVPPRKHGNIPL